MSEQEKDQLNLKRCVVVVPHGLKIIYNRSNGEFFAEVNIFGPTQEAQENFPGILADIATALAATKAANESLRAAEQKVES